MPAGCRRSQEFVGLELMLRYTISTGISTYFVSASDQSNALRSAVFPFLTLKTG